MTFEVNHIPLMAVNLEHSENFKKKTMTSVYSQNMILAGEMGQSADPSTLIIKAGGSGSLSVMPVFRRLRWDPQSKVAD